MPIEELFVGVDGGGTKTTALIARNIGSRGAAPEWDMFGRGVGGPSNPNNVGFDASAAAVAEAIRAAVADSGRSVEMFAGVCAGIAGAGSAESRGKLGDRLKELGVRAKTLDVTSDLMILFDAGTPQGWGIVMIGGTGSSTSGRTPGGKTTRAGGWGYKFDDRGSSYALAIEALRAVARSADGRGPATGLTNLVLRELGVSAPNELIRLVYAPTATPESIARLGPLVFQAAQAGDVVALGILHRETLELAETVRAVAQTLGMTTEPFPLALAGTLLLEQEAYRDSILAQIRAHRLRPDPVTLVREPAEGALLRAFRLAHVR